MLSDEEKEHYKNGNTSGNAMEEDYGIVDIVVPNVNYNQESVCDSKQWLWQLSKKVS